MQHKILNKKVHYIYSFISIHLVTSWYKSSVSNQFSIEIIVVLRTKCDDEVDPDVVFRGYGLNPVVDDDSKYAINPVGCDNDDIVVDDRRYDIKPYEIEINN